MKLLYFAWVRTRMGTAGEEVAPPPEVRDVAGLIDWLARRDSSGAAAFADRDRIRAAVNQDFAEFDHPVAMDDEVAFFPPVTGG